jgi:triacylglycerol lipase
MKSKYVIFVPGVFGWGPGELGGFPYWGDALQQFTGFKTHEAKCGPISSFHDRACEVFAQIKGTEVHYGLEHSAVAGHAQTSRDYTSQGLVPDWSVDNPIILIGHSAGAQTCLQLQQLLAEKFWHVDSGVDSNGNWIEAIICVAGVLDGSILTYMFCDEKTGRLKRASGFLVQSALAAIEALRIAALPVHDFGGDYDLYLDQWIGKANATSAELLEFFNKSHRFADGEDNLAFDLSLQGCVEANRKFQTRNETYYFSLVTRATHEAGFLGLPFGPKTQQPDKSMNLLLEPAARFQALKSDFAEAPIKDWGSGDLAIDKWRENDGAVSSISQRFPFTAGAQPLGGEGIFGREPEKIEKGKWYFEDIESIAGARFDHLDPVFGAKLKRSRIKDVHATLYDKLNALLQSL